MVNFKYKVATESYNFAKKKPVKYSYKYTSVSLYPLKFSFKDENP